MKDEGDGDTTCNWYTWNNPQTIGEGTGRLGNKRACRNQKSIPNIIFEKKKKRKKCLSLITSRYFERVS